MSELSAYQKKIFPIDDHVGCSIAGLTSDGRLLRCVLYRIHTMSLNIIMTFSRFMRTECLNSRFLHDTEMPLSRLVTAVGNSILTTYFSATSKQQML